MIIPVEFNYLLNPLHSGISEVRTVQSMDFEWDERLF